MKTITFTVPCFNSAEYMDKCIQTLVDCDGGHGDVEILIVDDGSTKDNTLQVAQGWQERYPDMVRAIHKENGGHGSAVNTGLANATGVYFKVVDSDDWLSDEAMVPIMAFLREQAGAVADASAGAGAGASANAGVGASAGSSEQTGAGTETGVGAGTGASEQAGANEGETPCDLVIGNYVYEKVYEDKRTVMDYKNVFPQGRIFGWEDIHHFHTSQYLLMHSVIYRTQMLRDMGLQLPEHCFYVDNIFVYEPLPHVKTIRYFDVDMYRYFIGREGQSVNQETMMKRIDQQLRVTRIMIDAVDLATVPQKKLRNYMENYLSMMMCICSVFLRMIDTDESEEKLHGIWDYLKEKRPNMYTGIRTSVLNIGTNLPTRFGRLIGLGGYHLAQKIFKFN